MATHGLKAENRISTVFFLEAKQLHWGIKTIWMTGKPSNRLGKMQMTRKCGLLENAFHQMINGH